MPSPPFLRPLVVACLLGALALSAAPEAQGEEAPRDGVTALEAGPFRRADAVLAGTVEQVTDLRAPGGALGRQVVRVRVARTFKGAPRVGENVTVLVQGQRPTLDPARPSVPYFRAGSRDRVVLFLGREDGGVAYNLETLYDAGGKTGAEKEAAVAAVAEIAAEPDEGERGRKALAWLLAGLAGSGPWTKAHAARELGYLASRRPHLFDKRVRARLRRLPASMLSTDERFWLRRVFRVLEAAGPASTPGAQAAEENEDPFRSRFLQATDPEARQALLVPLLDAPGGALADRAWWAYRRLEPSLRVWFVRQVGQRGAPGAVPALLSLYAGEEEPSVRESIVRSVGLLGRAGEVRWLAGRLGNVTLERAALLALARVRTPEALVFLRAALRAARSGDGEDLAAWIEHLLSPAFVESERRAGRAVGPR